MGDNPLLRWRTPAVPSRVELPVGPGEKGRSAIVPPRPRAAYPRRPASPTRAARFAGGPTSVFLWGPSRVSPLIFRVEVFELDAGVLGGELPVDLSLVGVDRVLPCGEF